MSVEVLPVPGIPEVRPGDDLVAMLATALLAAGARPGDVVAVTQKIVSKAEGRVVSEADADRALWIERESAGVVARRDDVVIARTRHGFVCANAGVDASNAPAGEPDTLILLPVDPDASARALRARLRSLTGVAPAVVITDSFGRAWRHGQTDVAIGAAGLAPLEDWRGRRDGVGRELHATWIALADQIAGAADLVRGKDSRQPVVIVSGLDRHVLPPGDDGPGAAALLRPASEDLFR